MKVPALRLVTFVVAAGFIVLGPAYSRTTGASVILQSWAMFHTRGIGICDAEFLDGRDASLPPLDRWKVLGVTKETAPRVLRRMDQASDVDEVAERLCQALGRGADVRIRGRCATAAGWVTSHTPAQNACRSGRRSTPSTSSEAPDGH